MNWLLTPHLFKDVSRSLVSKHTDFEIILLTVKQWFTEHHKSLYYLFSLKNSITSNDAQLLYSSSIYQEKINVWLILFIFVNFTYRSTFVCVQRFEGLFGCCGDSHFCVTNAMREDLNKNWGIKRTLTVYDRPPKVFSETSLESQHEVKKSRLEWSIWLPLGGSEFVAILYAVCTLLNCPFYFSTKLCALLFSSSH